MIRRIRQVLSESQLAQFHSNDIDRSKLIMLYFTEAKILSDFVAILTRLSFCMFGFGYMLKKSMVETQTLLSVSYMLVSIGALVLYFKMLYRVSMMTYGWLLGRTYIPSNTLERYAYLLAAGVLWMLLTYGVSRLITELAVNLLKP